MNRLVEILIILMVMVMMMIIDFAVWLTSKVVVALLLSGTIVESSYTFTPQYAAMSCFTRAKTGKDILITVAFFPMLVVVRNWVDCFHP